MAALSVAALGLCACSSSVADLTSFGASDAPKPKEPSGYLPVHDLPPPRNEPAIKPADQIKIQTELLATRDRQAAAAAAAK